MTTRDAKLRTALLAIQAMNQQERVIQIAVNADILSELFARNLVSIVITENGTKFLNSMPD